VSDDFFAQFLDPTGAGWTGVIARVNTDRTIGAIRDQTAALQRTMMVGKEVPCPYCAQLIAREASICSQCHGTLRLGSFHAMRLAIQQDPSLTLKSEESLAALQNRVRVLDRLIARQTSLAESVKPTSLSLDAWGQKMWKDVAQIVVESRQPIVSFTQHAARSTMMSKKEVKSVTSSWNALGRALARVSQSPDWDIAGAHLRKASASLYADATELNRSPNALAAWPAYVRTQCALAVGLHNWLPHSYGDLVTGLEILRVVDSGQCQQGELSGALTQAEYWLTCVALQNDALELSTTATSLLIRRFMVHDGRTEDADVALGGVASGPHSGRFATVTAEAVVRYSRGDTAAAEDLLNRALTSAEDPRGEVLYYLSHIADGKGDHAQAATYRDRLLVEDPTSRFALAEGAQRAAQLEALRAEAERVAEAARVVEAEAQRAAEVQRVAEAEAKREQTAGTQAVADAGWFPDPHGLTRLRYWDGSTWTEHVAD